jgi:hypothetical protein
MHLLTTSVPLQTVPLVPSVFEYDMTAGYFGVIAAVGACEVALAAQPRLLY